MYQSEMKTRKLTITWIKQSKHILGDFYNFSHKIHQNFNLNNISIINLSFVC